MRPCPTVRILGGNKAWHNGHGLWCRVPFPYGRRCLFLLVAFATHESLSAPVPSVRSFSRFPPQSGITSAARPHKGKVGSANTVCSNRCLASDSPALRTFLLVRSGRLSRISFPALSTISSFTTAVPLAKAIVARRPKSLHGIGATALMPCGDLARLSADVRERGTATFHALPSVFRRPLLQHTSHILQQSPSNRYFICFIHKMASPHVSRQQKSE